MLIIGLGHRCRQGKDVACSEMIWRAGAIPAVARSYSIGEEVLLFCVENGILPVITRGEIQLQHPEYLKTLQEVGHHQREHRPNIWMEKILSRINREKPDIAIIPNIRVPVEAQTVKNSGGVTVKVERLNMDGSPFIAMDRDANDETETALTMWNWDYVLRAKTGQTRWLERQAAALIAHLVEAR